MINFPTQLFFDVVKFFFQEFQPIVCPPSYESKLTSPPILRLNMDTALLLLTEEALLLNVVLVFLEYSSSGPFI